MYISVPIFLDAFKVPFFLKQDPVRFFSCFFLSTPSLLYRDFKRPTPSTFTSCIKKIHYLSHGWPQCDKNRWFIPIFYHCPPTNGHGATQMGTHCGWEAVKTQDGAGFLLFLLKLQRQRARVYTCGRNYHLAAFGGQ